MRELEIVLDETGTRLTGHRRTRLAAGRQDTFAEESEFVAVGVAGVVLQVAREIPPFGFKIRVHGVIARKLVNPTWQREAPTRLRCVGRASRAVKQQP